MNRLEEFNRQRPLLFSIAYRMLGSVMDAEDVLQEAFLRWHAAPEEEIRSPKAYLSTIITRLCLDQLKSARSRREVYVGPWLPEPLFDGQAEDLAGRAELADTLSTAFLVLLESLTPIERAVFLLRAIFDYDYPEIAGIVEKSEANCRQMVSRARRHLSERRPRYPVSAEQQNRLTGQFIRAVSSGDLQGLVSMLAADVVIYSDGGGKATAARNPIYGPDKVARFITGVTEKLSRDFVVRLTSLAGGQPAIVTYNHDRPLAVLTLEYEEEKIKALYLQVNPDKLPNLPPPGRPLEIH